MVFSFVTDYTECPVTKRVDRDTLKCHAHDRIACNVCMIDDFFDWLDAKKAEIKATRETPIDERFDIGGES